jgi:hypothetical protein
MWHHGIAEPKSRKSALLRVPMWMMLGLVEALERGEWPAAVSEFTGVVVLDDPRA